MDTAQMNAVVCAAAPYDTPDQMAALLSLGGVIPFAAAQSIVAAALGTCT